jgi:hypothetical protein
MNMPDAIASRLIGSLFVERGLVSESQIRVALEIQRETGAQLGQILVDQFGVSRKELTRVVAEQWRDVHGGDPGSGPDAGPGETWRPLGEIFVTRGFVSEDELDAALQRQRKTGERLGEALVALGVISKFELAGALGEQMATLKAVDEAEAHEANVVSLHPRPSDEDAAAELGTEAPTLSVVQDDPDAAEAPDAHVEEPAPEADVVLDPEPALREEEAVEVVAQPIESDPAPDEIAAVAEVEADVAVEAEDEPDVEQEPAPATGFDTAVDDWLEPGRFVAYASTPWGYRLVALDVELPSVGDVVDVPDVGALVVSRVGRSPLPLDTRLCVFAEQPLAAAAR